MQIDDMMKLSLCADCCSILVFSPEISGTEETLEKRLFSVQQD